MIKLIEGHVKAATNVRNHLVNYLTRVFLEVSAFTFIGCFFFIVAGVNHFEKLELVDVFTANVFQLLVTKVVRAERVQILLDKS